MRISTEDRHKLEEDAAYLVAMAAFNGLQKSEIEDLIHEMESCIRIAVNTTPIKKEDK
jgi:hypothetical protein